MLQAAMHKMIPSFSIVGINPEFEKITKKIEEYAATQLPTGGIDKLLVQLEYACEQACSELEEEMKLMEKA